MNKEQKMETINEYQETIDLFGKKREVTITIKVEPDPDAISIIEDCEPDPFYSVENYERGVFSVDLIFVEVKCDLFSGTDCLGGCFARAWENSVTKDHLETVECNEMVEQAIDDYKTDAKRYKDFFEP
jgi:hypothetical protein